MYFHINTLLEFIKKRENREFKVVKSKDYDINQKESYYFRAILPSEYDIETMTVKEEGEYGDLIFTLKDKKGRDLLNDSIIILWDTELATQNGENHTYIDSDAFENGVVIFENFKNIDMIISFDEISNELEA